MTKSELDQVEAELGLDETVAIEVMRWHKGSDHGNVSSAWYSGKDHYYVGSTCYWHPSTSIDQCINKVLKQFPHWWTGTIWEGKVKPFCYINVLGPFDSGGTPVVKQADTLEIAICEAAIAAAKILRERGII